MTNEERGVEPAQKMSVDVDHLVPDSAAGDFVGRDHSVFAGVNAGMTTNVYVSGDHNLITIRPRVDRIGTQIERLRGRITRMIPTQAAIVQLKALREPKPINQP